MKFRTLPAVLSIAGSDSSGGAGIEADLKTMTALGVYGMCAITAVTAQNTRSVIAIEKVSAGVLRAQIDAVFADIPPQAVKIGMVSDEESIAVIADALERYRPQHIVLDPVMISTSGKALLQEGAVQMLVRRLFPLASVITPNLPEAQTLIGCTVADKDEMLAAAKMLGGKCGGAVLLKGGHLAESSDDLLLDRGETLWISGERVDNPNTHGTGCTLSSAIAAYLARGCLLPDAIRQAKAYVAQTLQWGLDLGKGSGPLCHMAHYLSKWGCNGQENAIE